MGIAQEIFSKEDTKTDFTALLSIRQKIYAELFNTRKGASTLQLLTGLKTLSLIYYIDFNIAEET